MWLVYVFEAKGIQPYILSGGRLRHVAGGSAIVHDLCTEPPERGLLGEVLAASGLAGRARFLRCAGGSFAFALPEEDDARLALNAFHLLWTLAVQCEAPGLPFVDALAAGPSVHDALALARETMSGRRGFAAHALPAATPPVVRAPRTGNAAVGTGLDGDYLDENLFAKEARIVTDRRSNAASPLLQMFIDGSKAVDWPVDMEEDFPFVGEDRTVAIFHADGNRMGELVRVLGEHLKDCDDEAYCKAFLKFSKTVDNVTRHAVRTASLCIQDSRQPNRRYPARPVVCAGDDLTVILRADIALPFAKAFLSTFEAQVETVLLPLLKGFDLGRPGTTWPRLTACGGLIYCHANQPFLSVSALAESACKHAKSEAKALAPKLSQTVPSCLTLHRITGSLIEDYFDILKGELVISSERVLTANPYAIERDTGLASLSDLEAVVQAMATDGAIGGGVFREVASLLHVSEAEGKLKFARIRERAVKNPAIKAAWEQFEQRYTALLSTIPDHKAGAALNLFAGLKSPYNDAISLRQIGARSSGAAEAAK